MENRDQLLRTYENMLKKEKETERCKRDIQGYQQMFVRNTPTPKKLQCEVRVTLVVQSHYFKFPHLLVTDVAHYSHQPFPHAPYLTCYRVSVSFVQPLCRYYWNMVWFIWYLCEIHFLQEVLRIQISWCTCSKRQQVHVFSWSMNSNYHVTHIRTPFCGHLSNYMRMCSFFQQCNWTGHSARNSTYCLGLQGVFSDRIIVRALWLSH
jgi:hypothetical protein